MCKYVMHVVLQGEHAIPRAIVYSEREVTYDDEQVREMLGWCSLINIVLLVLMFVLVTAMRSTIYKIHSKLFPITESQFNIAIYSFFGFYKVVVYVFNIIPWVALWIISG